MSERLSGFEIRVRGIVQGVGFRPTVYKVATAMALNGEVLNDTNGVIIRLLSDEQGIAEFIHRLHENCPELARIDAVETTEAKEAWQYSAFSITASQQVSGITDITADAATCQACLDEVFNPNEPRYLYPFTNCTHCGPRLSIVNAIPYDLGNTSMKAFPFCGDCESEYHDPLDRRFHAQPVACHECGPELSLIISGESEQVNSVSKTLSVAEKQTQTQGYLRTINQALKNGKILAIKGLGGFHLCCDATNHTAVATLRERKLRYGKPFALMTPDMAQIRQYCELSEMEATQLQQPAAPIVLLNRRNSPLASEQGKLALTLSPAIAPHSNLLGFMLPYTPLHHLICREFGKPLVMTSGNLSGEPQIIDNQEATEKLSSIADLLVLHNRDIVNRIDDSVLRVVAGKPRIIRRARGFAPQSLTLPEGFEQAEGILAFGAELKSTFCMVKQGKAFVSQHQGDLEDALTFDDYEHNLQLYQHLLQFDTQHMVCDLHPEYLSTKLANERIDNEPVNSQGEAKSALLSVQHHHAHIASAMVENQLPLAHGNVLGIALDGLGMGDDHTFWGGEFLLTRYESSVRVGRLSPVAMPGGAQAIKQPWRNTYAHIAKAFGFNQFCRQYPDLPLTRFLQSMPFDLVQTMLDKGVNCPEASSAGRLFDAVAAAVGPDYTQSATQVLYEGQAAIELEMLVDTGQVFGLPAEQAYRLDMAFDTTVSDAFLEIDTASLWPQLLNDLCASFGSASHVSASNSNAQIAELIATRFHAGLIYTLVNAVAALAQRVDFSDVVLSGGCFQNAVLLKGVSEALQNQGFNCVTHSVMPANDGGIALGQAAIAAAKTLKS